MFCSCAPAKFVVTSEKETGIFDNCIIRLKPLTSKSERISKRIDGAVVRCGEYNIGDTLTLTRKEFTNF